MEVKLNEVLTTHLADYNVNPNLSSATGRTVARDTTIAPTSVVTAARYPLGKVYEMIPYDIIPEANQQWAVASINKASCADRIRVWKMQKIKSLLLSRTTNPCGTHSGLLLVIQIMSISTELL